MKGKKVTITIEMICVPDEYETVCGIISWLKKDLKQSFQLGKTCFKKIKFSSKIEKIEVENV